MNLKYNINNQLNLSQLLDGYELPQKYRAKVNEVFKYVYSNVCENYSNSRQYKQRVVDGLNILTYHILTGDNMPLGWSSMFPFDCLPEVSSDDVIRTLQEYYLEVDSICWDVNTQNIYYPETVKAIDESNSKVKEARLSESHQVKFVPTSMSRPLSQIRSSTSTNSPKLQVQSSVQINSASVNKMTPFDDLLLEPGLPFIPRVDTNKPWISIQDEKGETFTIYTSVPEIPEKQSDISVTTEVSKLIPSELMKLFPNRFIRMRHPIMYQYHEGYTELDYDDDLGVIFPVPGFTKEQVIDNIIKYPDIINIGPGRVGVNTRTQETIWAPFDDFIEIDGQLVKVDKELWRSLPEMAKLPCLRPFKQEYVIRKYLLERDNGISHNKDIFGTLYPFITLFMPMDSYIRRGYTDTDNIVMQCVKSRVSYYRSRNPLLLRLGLHYNYEGELIKS